MRYQIQLATSVDVAFLAAVIDEDRDQWNSQGEGEGVPIDRLLQTCACSTQVWAARDSSGTPTALWGVTPVSDDPDVGHLWMLACEAFDNNPSELESLSRLVFGDRAPAIDRLYRRAGHPAAGCRCKFPPRLDRFGSSHDRRPGVQLAELTPSFHLRADRLSG
jgi:hypothetical protein